MRRFVLPLIIFSLILSVSSVNAGPGTPADAVISYFEACRNGDVKTMETLIAGHFYDNKKILLSQNKDYPNFLKDYYQNLQVTILSSSMGNFDMVAKEHPNLYDKYLLKGGLLTVAGNNGVSVVTVSFKFPDRSAFSRKFLLKKDEGDNWKIYEQIIDY